jgi:hypothetical protein
VTDEQIKQRIKYLVEHGGVWDDPLEDMRRKVTTNRVLASAALMLLVVDILVELLV